MEHFEWLLQWNNFLYLLALGFSLTWSLIQILLGAIPDSIDADADVDAEVDVDADADADAEVGHDWIGGARFLSDVMAFFGIGKAPITILVLVFLFLFGSTGLILNGAFRFLLGIPVVGWLFQIPLMLLVLILAGYLTGKLAIVFNKFLPNSKTTSESGHASVGKMGTAASVITEKGGQVRIASGWVDAVTRPGGSPIPKDAQVLLVEYDQQHFRFTAEPM